MRVTAAVSEANRRQLATHRRAPNRYLVQPEQLG
jgi:hypothetical protein